MAQWTLFDTIPVMLKHPALDENSEKLPVFVAKSKKDILFWHLGYLASQAQTGQGGSGFEYTPLNDGQLEFDEAENCWIYRTDGGQWNYKFFLPDGKAKAWYQENKKYLTSPEKLKEIAATLSS